MATGSHGATTATGTSDTGTDHKTPAQLYSLLFGETLLVVGILGFLVESNIDFGNRDPGR